MYDHPGKANVVENALSRLSMGSVAHVEEERKRKLRIFTGLLAWKFAL